MNFKKLKKIKSFDILIVPSHSSSEAKKLSMVKSFFILTVYSFIIAIIGYFFFSLTPVGNLFLPDEPGVSITEMKKINELSERMKILTNELENLKSTNRRLKYAITLGDSSMFDSSKNKKDISNKNKKKLVEGNLFGIIRNLFFPEGMSEWTPLEDYQNNNVFNSDDHYFNKPVNGFISRDFNPELGHFGIDIVVRTGSPVYSAGSGYIIFSDYTVKDGYILIISHSNDYITIYKHCSALLKKIRDTIMQGELIALSGNTGDITTGPHLHFEVWKEGQPIDPKSVLINY